VLGRNLSFGPWVVFGAVLVFTYVLHGTEHFAALTVLGIFVILAIALDLLMGFTGLLSLGQAAIFGASAYTSAFLTVKLGWAAELAILMSILMAFSVALLMAPILRLAGYYFVMATLVASLISAALMKNWTSVTGGASGFLGIEHLKLFGFQFQSQLQYHVLIWAIAMGVVVLALNIRNSRFGQALAAVREDETAAQAFGIAPATLKIQIWLISAALTGLAGALYAHYFRYISPDQFDIHVIIMLLIMVSIGGAGSVYGAIIGAACVRFFPIVFAGLEHYMMLTFGIAIVAATVLMPSGLYGALQKLTTRVLAVRGRT
jgi:branched-chain amino acid transport system permease protein